MSTKMQIPRPFVTIPDVVVQAMSQITVCLESLTTFVTLVKLTIFLLLLESKS